MEYKLTKEAFSVSKTVFNEVVQQSAELDYLLPDYCPEIFKVLSIRMEPGITKRSFASGKLDYELTALIRLVYLSESGEVGAAEQSLCFGKSIDIATSSRSPEMTVSPHTESISCRVVNKRRVDIRGIISTEVRVVADEEREAISASIGGGIKLKRSLITYPAKRIAHSKRITVSDEVSLGAAREPLKTVLRADACIASQDKKVLSGKLLTKGEAEVNLLYIPENKNLPESIRFSIPFSQIFDIEGLDERFDVAVLAKTSFCDIKPVAKSDEVAISCELGVEIDICATRFGSAELALDCFSTVCNVNTEVVTEKIESAHSSLNETHREKKVLSYSDGEISSVVSAGGNVGKITITRDADGCALLCGRIGFYAYATNEAGRLVYIEGSEELRHRLTVSAFSESGRGRITAAVSSASYNLTSSNTIEITLDIKLCGCIYEESEKCFIKNIILNETEPVCPDKDVAIKLYYAEKGEDPWNIAKRCHASVEAILEENELEPGSLSGSGMILIPITE